MPYIPITDTERDEMLKALGLSSIDELFAGIPRETRFPTLALESGVSEAEALREIASLAETNTDADRYRWFLGAGAYDHFIPAAVSALACRGEFLTAYTPYQAEVSQGTLQAIFEFQSMIAGLTGMEVATAGHYDGTSALAEAVLLALREGGGRRRILLPYDIHPEYRAVLNTYLSPFDPVFETYTSSPAAAALAGEDPACLIAGYPGFFGTLPDLNGAADAVHKRGGLFIVHADPLMLGLLKNPGAYGADLVTAEGQSLGNELNYGGPFLGIIAAAAGLMRKIPGRIVGEARDGRGRRGYLLTLAAREQHIRRERAVSNICSNQGLAMLRACIYLTLMGKWGLRRAAELCWHKSHYAAVSIARSLAHQGVKVPALERGEIFFKEFTVILPCNAETAAEELWEQGIVSGLPLSRYFPDRSAELLVCVTEKNTKADIDALVNALGGYNK